MVYFIFEFEFGQSKFFILFLFFINFVWLSDELFIVLMLSSSVVAAVVVVVVVVVCRRL